jgi:hypothetical protein
MMCTEQLVGIDSLGDCTTPRAVTPSSGHWSWIPLSPQVAESVLPHLA